MTSTQNIEAEKYLLSCVMIDPPNVLSSAMEIGKVSKSSSVPCFRSSAHSRIVTAGIRIR